MGEQLSDCLAVVAPAVADVNEITVARFDDPWALRLWC
jgi:hypothetical protein